MNEKSHFIPWQSYEDLVYLVVGIVVLAATHLKEDKDRTMVQRRSGSDDVEYEFSGICQRDSAPNTGDVRTVVSRRSATRACSFSCANKANTSGDDNIYCDELTGKLHRKKPKVK